MKTMAIREFLRGGYKDLDDVTVVSNHGRPIFTVFPHTIGFYPSAAETDRALRDNRPTLIRDRDLSSEKET